MKLTELEPRWYSVGDSKGIAGISFLCPHCKKDRLGVRIDSATPHIIQVDHDNDITTAPINVQVWQIAGNTPSINDDKHGGFENVTLTPSVDASASGHWHGHITNGEIK
jgi:hypothetical protein